VSLFCKKNSGTGVTQMQDSAEKGRLQATGHRSLRGITCKESGKTISDNNFHYLENYNNFIFIYEIHIFT
jgi:hypothetical protein